MPRMQTNRENGVTLLQHYIIINQSLSVLSSFLVIDHSVQVDFSGDQSSLLKNQNLEFERNKERFQFLKWGSDAFDGLEIVPPGSGIVHQVNLEYLARVVFNKELFHSRDSL